MGLRAGRRQLPLAALLPHQDLHILHATLHRRRGAPGQAHRVDSRPLPQRSLVQEELAHRLGWDL